MKNIIQGLVITLIGGAAIWGALKIPAAQSQGETWSGLVPMVVACCLVLIGLMMTVSDLKAAKSSSNSSTITFSRTDLDVVGLVVISILYHQAMIRFGYLIPTAIIAPVVLAFFGVRSPLGLILSAILCPLIFHLVFFKFLGVFPPYGEVFEILDVIGG